ncbi:MAG TPA: Fic family protein [Albitalea sp.]|nr:Fic family protein [Albitalea sp.]
MKVAGYEFVREALGLQVFPVECPAVVRPVTRVQRLAGELAVPVQVAPRNGDIVDHLLFALKHEGTNLQLIAAACEHLAPWRLLDALRATPSGGYIRKLCYLWEHFSQRELSDLPAGLGGVAVPLFDPALYLVSDSPRRDRKWRVDFNGLGNWRFCPSVSKTPQIEALLGERIMQRVENFLDRMDPALLDRALAWAYLDETRSSYEIEREPPSEDKAAAFVSLLRQAHDRRPLSEDYFVELQNAAVGNPLLRASGFRHEQNHLKGPAKGAPGVTYVPPPPHLLDTVMEGLMQAADPAHHDGIDPLVRAALVSFGFVFAHPFMDGNGRLSRFLVHYTLCQTGALERGHILPVSAAMKRHELDYLGALQSFSRPARALWGVTWIDADRYLFEPRFDPRIYIYWDATRCVEFTLRMAKLALEQDLAREAQFLAGYDKVMKEVDRRFDLIGSTLSTLVLSCHQNGGVLSKHRRRQFAATVPADAFDFIEAAVQEHIARPDAADK